MASSGISSPRASLDRALAIAQREGLSGPPVVSAARRWAATAALIVLLTVFRSLNLCVVAMLGLAPFLASSPVGQFFTRSLGYARLIPARLAAVAPLQGDE
jgi:hypothetical protein